MGNNPSCLKRNERSAAGRNPEPIGKKELEVYDICQHVLELLVDRTEDQKLLESVFHALGSIKKRQYPFLKTLPDRFESLPEFLKWCDKKSVQANKVKVEIFQEFGGMGIVAAEEIKKDEEVFKVFYTAMMNSADGRKRSDYLTEPLEISDAWVQVPIALDIVREVHNPLSKFKQYLDVLPKDIAHPVLFGLEDFNAMRGTTALGSCLGLFYEVLYHYCLLYRKVYENTVNDTQPAWESLDARTLTAELYIWAMTVALTRTLKVHDNCDKTVTVMVPYWDCCNNGTEDLWTHVQLKVDETTTSGYTTESSLSAYAYHDIPAGKEIQLTYRESTTPIEFLTVWGIVSIDWIKIYVTLPHAVLRSRYSEKQKKVTEVGISIYNNDDVINAKDADLIMRSIELGLTEEKDDKPLDRGFLWSKVLQFLEQSLHAQKGWYELNVVQCRRILQSSVTTNMKLAVRYVLEEQLLIEKAIARLPALRDRGPPPLPAKPEEKASPDAEEESDGGEDCASHHTEDSGQGDDNIAPSDKPTASEGAAEVSPGSEVSVET